MSSWTREVVGLGPDVFLVHDEVDATRSVSLDWLLHGYRSDPPAPGADTYSYTGRRTENTFETVDDRHWSLRPQDAAPLLHVADVSAATWAAVVEPGMYVPELNPDTREYNEDQEEFQVGHRLRRTRTATRGVSTVALWFGDGLAAESWSDGTAEALRLHDATDDVAVAIWPEADDVAGFHGYDVTGGMAGRRFDAPAYLARAATRFASGTTTLLAAASPVGAFVRFEHAATATDPHTALVDSSAPGDVAFYCPTEPTEVLLDGSSVPVSWSASTLTVPLAAGRHRIELR